MGNCPVIWANELEPTSGKVEVWALSAENSTCKSMEMCKRMVHWGNAQRSGWLECRRCVGRGQTIKLER